jgi:hypothetical protein
VQRLIRTVVVARYVPLARAAVVRLYFLLLGNCSVEAEAAFWVLVGPLFTVCSVLKGLKWQVGEG